MEEKLQAINWLQFEVMAKNIASELSVSKSTVGDWKENWAEFEKWCAAQASGSEMKKKKKKKKHAKRYT